MLLDVGESGSTKRGFCLNLGLTASRRYKEKRSVITYS